MLNTTEVSRNKDAATETIRRAPEAPRGGASPWGETDARTARAGHELRRLRYLRDLLVEGFRAARTGDLPSGSLRVERVALGIGLPELDAVPLWSSGREDGAVSIPFIEFILAQFIASLGAFWSDLEDRGAAAGMLEHSHALEQALREANQGGATALALPRLGDTFLPELLVMRVCGHRGLLDRTVAECERLMLERR